MRVPKFLKNGVILPAALIGGMALPSLPGCVSDVRDDPEFQVALQIAEKIKGVRLGGVTVEEEPVLADLLVSFNRTADALDGRLADRAAEIKAAADRAAGAAQPFVPAPFNGLVDPTIAGILYFILRRQNKGALDALKAEVLGGPAKPPVS